MSEEIISFNCEKMKATVKYTKFYKLVSRPGTEIKLPNGAECTHQDVCGIKDASGQYNWDDCDFIKKEKLAKSS